MVKEEKEVKEERMTKEELIQQLQAEEQSKREAFMREIDEVCQKHGYTLQIQQNIIPVPIG